MTEYLKGKDIKTKGDCLVYCFTRRIEVTSDLSYIGLKHWNKDFEKW